MNDIQLAISALQCQMVGSFVTTPCTVRFERSTVTVDFELAGRTLSFEFVVTGHELRLVSRDMRERGVEMSNVVLHNFSLTELEQRALEIGHRDFK